MRPLAVGSPRHREYAAGGRRRVRKSNSTQVDPDRRGGCRHRGSCPPGRRRRRNAPPQRRAASRRSLQPTDRRARTWPRVGVGITDPDPEGSVRGRSPAGVVRRRGVECDRFSLILKIRQSEPVYHLVTILDKRVDLRRIAVPFCGGKNLDPLTHPNHNRRFVSWSSPSTARPVRASPLSPPISRHASKFPTWIPERCIGRWLCWLHERA